MAAWTSGTRLKTKRRCSSGGRRCSWPRRRRRRERVPWPIHLDDFMLMGRVDRGSRPAVWIYKHRDSRRELNLDSTGQAYKFTRTPNGRSYGRFTACDIRSAVYRAGLPAFVEPVWYDDPPRHRGSMPRGCRSRRAARRETWPLPGNVTSPRRARAPHRVDAPPTRRRRRPRPVRVAATSP